MAVCWRCPSCGAISCEVDVNATGQPLSCDHCERMVLPPQTLCPICETPNPWRRRDSLHFICTECGNSQTYYSHLGATG